MHVALAKPLGLWSQDAFSTEVISDQLDQVKYICKIEYALSRGTWMRKTILSSDRVYFKVGEEFLI